MSTTIINSKGRIALTSLKSILKGVTNNVTKAITMRDAKIMTKLLRVNPVTYVSVNLLEYLGVLHLQICYTSN